MSYAELNTRIKHKRDLEANWSTNNPILLNGECIIVDMDDGLIRLKIGDGTNSYLSLPFIDDDLRSAISEINSIPRSTSDDNGKVLSVINGVPTWTSIDDIISIQKYYTGTEDPTSSIGSDGDLYLKTN